MNKFTILFLTLFLALPMAMKADSAKEKKDDTRYLVGAVPEVDGKVVFSKEFQIPGMSQAQIYDTMTKWMDERLKENKNIDSRIVFSDEAKGTIAGVGEEWIVFSSSALSLDRTLVNYQITVTCKPGNCLVELEKIRFTYRETEKYKAEEWITDKYALNKAKTKLVRGLAKWRRKTVDFADDMFMDVAVAFGAPDTRPKTEKKKKEEEQQKPSVVAAAGPIVIGQGGKVTTTESAQTTIPAATLTPATPATKVASDASGYTEIDLKQIPGEVYALMGSGKLVISIGKDEFNMTNMTANAGGALGYQSGKAVAYCTLSPDQPYDAIEKADSYTLKLYAPNQTTPSAVIECKKMPSQTTPQAGQPRTYVGEIVKLATMEIKSKFDHFNINVTNLERSIAFYEKALGLKEHHRKEASDGSFTLVYLTDNETGFLLELTWLKDHTAPYELGENESHLCFRVAGDYDAIRAYHKEMNCVCFENTAMGLYFINDPDDYWIEILPQK